MARVLVVDDTLIARHILSSLLEKMGHQVLEAASGAEALELLRIHCVEVMVLDVMMPDMDGFTVLEKLQHQPPRHTPVVVMVSALGRSELLARAQALGVQTVLSKPFGRREFQSTLHEALKRSTPCP